MTHRPPPPVPTLPPVVLFDLGAMVATLRANAQDAGTVRFLDELARQMLVGPEVARWEDDQ